MHKEIDTGTDRCPHLLYLAPGTAYSSYDIRSGGERFQIAVAPLESSICLLATTKVRSRLVVGDAVLKSYSCGPLIKLLSFIDQSNSAPQICRGINEALIQLNVDKQLSFTPQGLEKWFLLGMIGDDPVVTRLAQMFRRLEAYSLVKFLLAHRNCASIEALGTRYGLSVSHFRRKCKHALGQSIKREFRIWRATGSLLATAGHQFGLTNIALDHGYASSSHFSRDIKDLFGFAPTELYVEKILQRVGK